MIYLIVPNDEMLAQGDILDAVPATRLGDDGEPVVFLSRAVVLTQTCDLAQGKTTRVVSRTPIRPRTTLTPR